MLTRLCDEIAEAPEHLVPHTVVLGDVTGVCKRLESGIEIFAVAFELEIEGHVVDPCGQIVDLAVGNIQIERQLEGRALNAVAQTDRADRSSTC